MMKRTKKLNTQRTDMKIRIKNDRETIKRMIDRDGIPVGIAASIAGRTLEAEHAALVQGDFTIEFTVENQKIQLSLAPDCVEVQLAA